MSLLFQKDTWTFKNFKNILELENKKVQKYPSINLLKKKQLIPHRKNISKFSKVALVSVL